MKNAGRCKPGTVYFNGFMLYILKPAFSSIVLETILIRAPKSKEGTFRVLLAISSAKVFKLLKGESKIAHLTYTVLLK